MRASQRVWRRVKCAWKWPIVDQSLSFSQPNRPHTHRPNHVFSHPRNTPPLSSKLIKHCPQVLSSSTRLAKHIRHGIHPSMALPILHELVQPRFLHRRRRRRQQRRRRAGGGGRAGPDPAVRDSAPEMNLNLPGSRRWRLHDPRRVCASRECTETMSRRCPCHTGTGGRPAHLRGGLGHEPVAADDRGVSE